MKYLLSMPMQHLQNQTLFFIIIFAGLSLLPQTAESQDVYNFYFQKAPGPHTVIQGGRESTGQTSTSLPTTVSNPSGLPQAPEVTIQTEVNTPEIKPPSVPNNSVPTAPSVQPASTSSAALKPQNTETAPADNRKRWTFWLGGSQFLDGSLDKESLYRGYSLGIEYSPSRFVSLNLGGVAGNFIPKDGDRSKDGQYHMNAGIKLIPFRLSMFGFEVMEFQALAGVTSVNNWKKEESYKLIYNREGVSTSQYDGATAKSERTTSPYLGFGLGFYLGENHALQAQYRKPQNSDSGINYYQATVSYGINF